MAEPMDPQLKKFIRKNLPELKEETNCDPNLLDRIVAAGVFHSNDKEEIIHTSNPTPGNKASMFYEKLMQKSQDSYAKTIEALKASGQATAAAIMERGISGETGTEIWFEVGFPPDSFIGREVELESLHQLLTKATSKPTVINQIATVAGLGGIGKSELARKYAHTYSDYYSGNVIWINSETEESFRCSFARLHEKCFRTIKLNLGTDEELVQTVYDHFSTNGKKCLIILDNVEEFDVFKLLPKYLPTRNPEIPRVLITSRKLDWNIDVSVLNLDVLSVQEAVQIIKTGCTAQQELIEDELENLVKTLQCFPLTLQQTASYIKMELWSYKNPFKKYLELFNSQMCSELLKYKNERNTYNLWVLTMESIKMKKFGNIAIEIMNIISFFEPDNIPILTFIGYTSTAKLLDPLNIDLPWSEENVTGAINLLQAYSMINGSVDVINVHRLVQRVVQLRNKMHSAILGDALTLLEVILNNSDNTSKFIYSLLPHAESILMHASNHEELKQKFVVFISKLYDNQWVQDELRANPKVTKDFKSQFESFKDTGIFKGLRVRYYEAKALYRSKKYVESLKILTETLTLALSTDEGPNYQLTEFIYDLTLDNIIKTKTRELSGSIIKLVDLRLKNYSPEHEKILNALLNRANTLTSIGRIEEVKSLIRTVNEARNRVNYVTDKHIVVTMKSLAEALVKKGELLEEAIELFRTVVEMTKRVLGAEHDGTLHSMKDLANALVKNGDWDQALVLFRMIVEVRKRKDGAEQLSTLEAMKNLADALERRGDLDEAIELFGTIFEVRKSRDVAHLATLCSMKNLGDALVKKGELDETLSIYKSVQEMLSNFRSVILLSIGLKNLRKWITKIRWIKLRNVVLSSKFRDMSFS